MKAKTNSIAKLPDSQLPELCYGFLPSDRISDTPTISPIIIKRGESGYYQTDYAWNREHAEAALKKCNEGLGVSVEIADLMMVRSMSQWTHNSIYRPTVCHRCGNEVKPNLGCGCVQPEI